MAPCAACAYSRSGWLRNLAQGCFAGTLQAWWDEARTGCAQVVSGSNMVMYVSCSLVEAMHMLPGADGTWCLLVLRWHCTFQLTADTRAMLCCAVSSDVLLAAALKSCT
jgi:hypothetical protein